MLCASLPAHGRSRIAGHLNNRTAIMSAVGTFETSREVCGSEYGQRLPSDIDLAILGDLRSLQI
jgi:hypothetical protein